MLPIAKLICVSWAALVGHAKREEEGLNKLDTDLDVNKGFASATHAESKNQVGHGKSLVDCVAPLTSQLVQLGGTGNHSQDRVDMRNYLYGNDLDGVGGVGQELITLSLAIGDGEVSTGQRASSKAEILKKLRGVSHIKTLDALEELYKVASGFGIIRRTYENHTTQELARDVVDCGLALYDGSDYLEHSKPEDEVVDIGEMKWKTKFKYARTVFGFQNHFFNIYVMTWLPRMEGIIHSHGESACSFKFLTEGEEPNSFVSQGFHSVEGMGAAPGTPASKSVAFEDWKTEEHWGQCSAGCAQARLKDMNMTTAESVGNSGRGKVFYIQDDVGVHRFDNGGDAPGFTVNVYYPSYEKTWLFSGFDSHDNIVHKMDGDLKHLPGPKNWLDKYGRTAPVRMMAAWRQPHVVVDDEVDAFMDPVTSEDLGVPGAHRSGGLLEVGSDDASDRRHWGVTRARTSGGGAAEVAETIATGGP